MEFKTERILIEVNLESTAEGSLLVKKATSDPLFFINCLNEEKSIWHLLATIIKQDQEQSRFRFGVEVCPISKRGSLKIHISLKDSFFTVGKMKDLCMEKYRKIKNELSHFGIQDGSIKVISNNDELHCCVLHNEKEFRKFAASLVHEACSIFIPTPNGYITSSHDNFNATLYDVDHTKPPIFANTIESFKDILADRNFRFSRFESDGDTHGKSGVDI